MRSFFKSFIVFVLVFASIPWSSSGEIQANSTVDKLKVLQIVNASNQILTSTDKYDVKTMEMKEFVAERKDLDGLYDVIYIADGNYSPTLPVVAPDAEDYNEAKEWKEITEKRLVEEIITTEEPVYGYRTVTKNGKKVRERYIKEYKKKYETKIVEKEVKSWVKMDYSTLGQKFDGEITNDTSDKMNDITNLKADEIFKYYVEKGLPVYIHESIGKQDKETNKLSATDTTLSRQSILKDRLYLLAIGTEYTEIQVVKDKNDLLEKLNKNVNKVRPNIIVTNKDKISNQKYKKGDTLSINFKVEDKKSENLVINLYIDSDFNNNYNNKEVLVNAKLETLSDGKGNYILNYKLPNNFSGPRYWKLEIVDESSQNKLKDYELGYFEFSGEKIDIRVLQVIYNEKAGTIEAADYTKGNLVKILGTNKANDIDTKIGKFYVTETNKSGYYDHTDFRISIDVVTHDEFTSKTTSKGHYTKINSKDQSTNYNMLIFGFLDDYGINTKIFNDSKIQDEIKKYIESGKSLFLTHDTLYRDYFSHEGSSHLSHDSSWVSTFLESSGQTYEINPKTWLNNIPDVELKKIMGSNYSNLSSEEISVKLKEKLSHGYYLETNMGFRGPAKTTKAVSVNSGLMTTYPFSLPDNISIKKTHSQYFALDLENPDVIPWYNLVKDNVNTGSYKSEKNAEYSNGEDAWNHYYTYSYKNITYSGAGHSIEGFDKEEKQLFINTMYRAFLSANKPPIIKPITTGNVYSYQKTVPIEFSVEDYDLIDRFLDVKVTINNKIYNYKDVVNGATVIVNYELGSNDKELSIVVEASDKRGGDTGKENWKLDIFQVDTVVGINKAYVGNLETFELNNALTSGYYARNNKEVTLEYTIDFKPEIIPSEGNGFKEDLILNYELTDFIPADLIGKGKVTIEKSNLVNVAVNNTTTGTKITGKLPTINYKKQSNGKLKIQDNQNKFTVQLTFTPIIEGDFKLDQTKLIDKDKNYPLMFTGLQLKVREPLKDIILEEELFLRLGEVQTLPINFNPEEAKINDLIVKYEWNSKDESFVKIVEADKIEAQFKGEKNTSTGPTIVNVMYTDVFGNKVEKEVKVYVGKYIKVEPNIIEMEEEEKLKVSITVNPTNLPDKEYLVKIDDNRIAKWNEKTKEIEGLTEGETSLKVVLKADEQVYTEVPIIVHRNLKEIKFRQPYYQLKLGEKRDVTNELIFLPSNSTNKVIETVYSSSDTKVEVVLENGRVYVIGKEAGTSLITITGQKSKSGKIPKAATAFFEVVKENNSNSSSGGKW